MDLQLPITTINGQPIEDVGCALLTLVESLSERFEAMKRGEPFGHILLVPCVQRALVPIWAELHQADGPDPPELSPEATLLELVTAIHRLVEQVDDAVNHNWSRSAA